MLLRTSVCDCIRSAIFPSVYNCIHHLAWDSAPYSDWCYIYSSVYGSVASSMDAYVYLHVANLIKSYDT